MKTSLLGLLAVVLLAPITANAQSRDFQITKITKNLISPPQFAFLGAQQYTTNQRAMWLEVEVTFNSALEWTDDLTFRYFILVNGKMLTGEVTHTSIGGGRDLRSVMYVSPHTLARFNNNSAVTANIIQNIAVQIVQQGKVVDELSLMRAAANWYSSMPAVTGVVMNKNETPFGPIYWDRYEQIKTPGR